MSKTVMIDGIEYAPIVKTDANYVIVRSKSAGVFAGDLQSWEGNEVKLSNARRLWFWSGAASLSQLSVDGVANPDGCKFPCTVPAITILGVIEIIPCTEKARKSIEAVKVWKL